MTLYTPVDPSTVLQTVGSGTDDFGISYQPDVLLARAQGVPVVSVAGLVPHPLNSVIALKSSGITRPRDLVGKKVGYPAIPTNEPLLGTMLKTDGRAGCRTSSWSTSGLIWCQPSSAGAWMPWWAPTGRTRVLCWKIRDIQCTSCGGGVGRP